MNETKKSNKKIFRWKISKLLIANLNFKHVKKMRKYIQDFKFEFAFVAYVKKHIKSILKKTRNENNVKLKNAKFRIVETRLYVEKKSKNDKYSSSMINKIDWNVIDYQIKLLCDLKYLNIKNVQKLFYESTWINREIIRDFWAMYKYVEYNEKNNRKFKKKFFESIVIDKLIIQITISCIEFFDKSITFAFAFV